MKNEKFTKHIQISNSVTIMLFFLYSMFFLFSYEVKASEIKPQNIMGNTDIVHNATELKNWLNAHVTSPGAVSLAGNITFDDGFEYLYRGEGKLILNTGQFTLSFKKNINLGGENFLIMGEGVEGPVLFGKYLTLNNGVSAVATGRNGIGGIAVKTENLSMYNKSNIISFGQGSVGTQCSSIYASNSYIKTEGMGSVALKIIAKEENPYYEPGFLRLCTIEAKGENSVSVFSEGVIDAFEFFECDIVPSPNIGNHKKLFPSASWNSLIVATPPNESYQLPDSILINLYTEDKEIVNTNASILWTEKVKNFSAAGTYEVTGIVKDCDLKSLIGQEYKMTIQVGEVLRPVLNYPEILYDKDGKISTLSFKLPDLSIRDEANTDLWCSDDKGVNWKIYDKKCYYSARLNTSELNREEEYLIFLKSNKDGVMDGVSDIWSLTIHQDESITFVKTDMLPPDLEKPVLSASSWEELLAIENSTDRLENVVKITSDLIVDGHVDLRSKTPKISLDMGDYSIIVKDKGWLLLDIDTLQGRGTTRPLICVEDGGTIVLGNIDGSANGMYGMKIIAGETQEGEGAVALELQEGASIYADNCPKIYAKGNSAVALKSLSKEVFSLPAGLRLKAEGNNSIALQCFGDADIFYTIVKAYGENAQAVSVPDGCKIVSESAVLEPFNDNIIEKTAVFLDFNEDLDAPQNIWQGRTAGMYISERPYRITLKRADSDKTEPVWIQCTVDSSNVDFNKIGSYTSVIYFSEIFPVKIDGLPIYKEISVGVHDVGSEPDISIIHALPAINIGGAELKYGFTIYCNAPYDKEIATLWCSDDGKQWKNTDDLFDVFMDTYAWTIHVSGVIPDKTYLFYLESTGRNSYEEEIVMEGKSKIRQVTVNSDSSVVNLAWTGDRDGGDTDGNNPSDTVQPPPYDEDTNEDTDSSDNSNPPNDLNNTENDIKNKDDNFSQKDDVDEKGKLDEKDNVEKKDSLDEKDNSEDKLDTTNVFQEIIPINSPEKDNTDNNLKPEDEKSFMEKIGDTYSIISGIRLKMMIEDGKSAVFSKQKISISIPYETIYSLNIKDEDIFFIEIKRKNEKEFLLSIEINDEPVSSLDGMVLMVQYSASNSNSKFFLENESSIEICEGVYDEAIQVVSYKIENTGTFRIVEKLRENKPYGSEIEASSELDNKYGDYNRNDDVKNKYEGIKTVAIFSAILLACGILLFMHNIRRRK